MYKILMTEILEIRKRNALWIQSMSYIVSCGRIKGDIYAKYVREMRKIHKTEWTEIRGWKATFERFTSHLSRHPSPIWPSIVSFSTRVAVLIGGHTKLSFWYNAYCDFRSSRRRTIQLKHDLYNKSSLPKWRTYQIFLPNSLSQCLSAIKRL